MKLALHKLTQWHHTESYNIALSGPMSPMSAAKDFVSKVFEKGDMVITGLFRIQGDGETTFTTWENADIEPVQVDVICCILNFRHMAIFGEIGSRYMPIALILDGEAQFSELYTTYKWESAPTIQEIADVLSTINLTELKKQFEDYRWSVKAEQSIIGLRPWPGFVFSPDIPSDAYRFVQLNTDGMDTSSFCATSAFESCSLLRSIARQRTRNLWSVPCLYPNSNCRRSSSVSKICFFLAIIVCIRLCHNITY